MSKYYGKTLSSLLVTWVLIGKESKSLGKCTSLSEGPFIEQKKNNSKWSRNNGIIRYLIEIILFCNG